MHAFVIFLNEYEMKISSFCYFDFVTNMTMNSGVTFYDSVTTNK